MHVVMLFFTCSCKSNHNNDKIPRGNLMCKWSLLVCSAPQINTLFQRKLASSCVFLNASLLRELRKLKNLVHNFDAG